MRKYKLARAAAAGVILFSYPLISGAMPQSQEIPMRFSNIELFHDTEHILGKLHSTFVLEIQESRLAPLKSQMKSQLKSQNSRVRWIAKKMVADYNDADRKVIAQAARINAPLRDFVPEDLTEATEQQRSQDAMKRLENDESSEFDLDFINANIEDHKNEIAWLNANVKKLEPYNRNFVHQQVKVLVRNYLLLQQLRKLWPMSQSSLQW